MTEVQYSIENDDGGSIREPEFNEFIESDEIADIFKDLGDDFVVADRSDNNQAGSLNISESGLLLKEYIEHSGFGDHHIEVYDNWVYKTADKNVGSRMLRFKDGRVVCFENLQRMPPRYTRDGKAYPLTPKLAREQGVTYGSDWHVDIVLREGGCDGVELDRQRGVCIGNIPVMLKSRNCILHGKTPRQLALLGEDPDDPGGYFIISGVEKVILLQEQLAINKIFLMTMNSKGSTVARMTANTSRGTALIELALDNKTHTVLKMRFPSMRTREGDKQGQMKNHKSVNVLRVFRMLGVVDQADIQRLISLFIKPEYVKKSMLKLTRNLVDFLRVTDDINIMAEKMDKGKLTQAEKEAEVWRVFDTDLFPHLNNLQGPDGETQEERDERIIDAKINLLAIMVARFLEHMAGYRQVDDRDSWSNKRVEGAGRMMEQLFRNAWRKALGFVQGAIDIGEGVKDLKGVMERIKYSTITDAFHDSFITSNWGVKGTKMKNNVAQTLFRDSVVATFAHINTVDVGISRTDRQQKLRLVQMSQWGFICPVSTPEGENTGLLKNLSVTAKVSLERDDTGIIRFLIGDPDKEIEQRVFPNRDMSEVYPDKIIVNGKFLGWCNGEETRDFLVESRRRGEFFPDMSVILEEDWLYVDISPSRLVRPLLIVDQDQGLAIDRLGLRGMPPGTLIREGVMEYMSSWEQEYIKVAPRVEDIQKRLDNIRDAEETYRDAMDKLNEIKQQQGNDIIDEDTGEVLTEDVANERVEEALEQLNKSMNRPYTHCELDPKAILGVAAALIPWPNHNQAPRNTYQVSMGKQALGVYHANHGNRFDGKTKLLAFPNRPMVETEMYDIIGLNDRGPGENVIVAFLADPNTEEDSFKFKKGFLDNGGFRIIKYLTYKTIVRQLGDVAETLAKPEAKPGENRERYRYIQGGGFNNPVNGLPLIGAPLNQGDCVIGKMQRVPALDEIHNESTFIRVGDEGIVDKVSVTTDQITTVVNVKLRIMRVPQEGDKFAPRNAQKGTIGIVTADHDMPVSDTGISPDIIVNPHSIPSRMTMAYPMEMEAAKHGALRGVHINGSAFRPFEFETYRQTMKDYNRNEFGYETLRSGTSGKPLKALVYMGPVFFQALKHHVKDKVQARSKGAVKPMTRQPPKGRGNRGGLRFGEMERDAAISHGASAYARERLMYVSDGYQTVFCIHCGDFAINDALTRQYKCRMCGTDDFGRTTIPYGSKLLTHLLAPLGINLRYEFETSEEYADRIFHGTGDIKVGTVNDIEGELNAADEGFEEEMEEFEADDIDIEYESSY